MVREGVVWGRICAYVRIHIVCYCYVFVVIELTFGVGLMIQKCTGDDKMAAGQEMFLVLEKLVYWYMC